MKQIQTVEEINPTCRVCDGPGIKAGTRLDIENDLLSQQYKCTKCGTVWTAGKGRHMQKPDYVIRLAVALVKKGMYLQDVATLVSEATGFRINNATVGQWMKKYVHGYKPKLGRRPDPSKKVGGYYVNSRRPHQDKANLATIRSIRTVLKQIEVKLAVIEKRVVTGKGNTLTKKGTNKERENRRSPGARSWRSRRKPRRS